MHDVELAARLTYDPVTAYDLSSFEFLQRTMHADKGSSDATKHFMPVAAQFFGQYDLIADQIDAASGHCRDRAMVRFQARQPNTPKVKAHMIAFVAVEEKAIGIVVKAIGQHRESIINTRDAIGAHQFILKCARDACLAR